MKQKIFPNIKRDVWILGFVSLLTDISSKMIDSVLPLFLVSTLGANLLIVGLIEGIAESTASVLKVFSGILSDRLGNRKQLAVAGYGLSTLVKPLFALATSPVSVLIARFGDRLIVGYKQQETSLNPQTFCLNHANLGMFSLKNLRSSKCLLIYCLFRREARYELGEELHTAILAHSSPLGSWGTVDAIALICIYHAGSNSNFSKIVIGL